MYININNCFFIDIIMEGGKNELKNALKNENPYDLTRLVPIEKEEEIKKSYSIITESDRDKLLAGYSEVDEIDWGNIDMNAHIRYLRKDGAFRRGGYVKGHWIGTYGPKKGRNCIQMINNLSGYNPKTWNVCVDDITTIWIREDSQKNIGNIGNTSSSSKANDQSESIEFLTNQMEQLKIDMTRINNEQKRIINLIKKLHGIKSRT
jgi:hypothetical protein